MVRPDPNADRGESVVVGSAKNRRRAYPMVRSLTVDVFTEGGVVLRSHTHVFSGTNEDNEAFGVVQLATPAPSGGSNIALASSNPEAAAVPPSSRGPRRTGARELHHPTTAGRPPDTRSP